MAAQYSVAARNAQIDAIESAIGASPTLEIRTGVPPASCAAADTGTLLIAVVLPSDWLGAASNGSKALAGSWSGAVTGSGDVGHFRIKQGATCHIQGTASQRAADGGTGDLKIEQATPTVSAGANLTIASFTLSVGGA